MLERLWRLAQLARAANQEELAKTYEHAAKELQRRAVTTRG